MASRNPKARLQHLWGLSIVACSTFGLIGFADVFVRVASAPTRLGRARMHGFTRVSAIRPDLAEKMGLLPPGMLDVEKELQKSKFPIPPEDLIALAKAFTSELAVAYDAGEGEDAAFERWFADGYRFVAPVVGPFGKSEFMDSFRSINLTMGFPDLVPNYHHFRVDPFEPNRVWYSVKFMGTNTGPIMGRPATGKRVETPVQAHSVMFNEQGEITKTTIGYVLDKETGNSGGLGGIFGLLYGIGYGLPFPEAQPYEPSPIYGSLMRINRAIQDLWKANPGAKDAIFSFSTRVGK